MINHEAAKSTKASEEYEQEKDQAEQGTETGYTGCSGWNKIAAKELKDHSEKAEIRNPQIPSADAGTGAVVAAEWSRPARNDGEG
jgi:hypothetical protein